ncbi:argininosuccinate lyase [Rhodocaloribacter litoris]|uniref:argininosuccinate lyase n=1 Tax=Rhodocaloribacter litoris TaxID=2558931 RepID=UPI001E3F4A85|nr:argininosuccinate lyase [Rhodocaloribacter litoris]QXD14378.1 argininosuccinate lyase [Rhodocaloribacter litoris]
MLWQKDTRVEDWVTRFTVGEDYRWDTLLLPYDIEGTRAHAWGLAQIGLLSAEEFARIEDALGQLLADYEAGHVTVTPADEDCHTVIETYLTEHLGEVGKKIHTGRSRNDQVLTALRLFLREQLRARGRQVHALAEALCRLGDAYDDALMPGYTHLQRAMPTTAGQWALGYAECLLADLDALRHAAGQVNVSPLGSAAGYGVPYLELPREEVARRLGFDGVQTHVTAVQLSRGKLELHVAHALVQVGATLNRMASDLVLFNSAEFGFVELPAEYCTGSSIMPQKQNPDVLELARATYHRLLAEMNVLLTLPANLPSGYHRDLQLTKEAVMRCTLLAGDLLAAMNHVVPGLRFDRERLAEACTPELYATAHALELVRDGVPFREAYRKAAQAVGTRAAPDAADALAAYRVDGFPGRGRPDLLRRRLEAHRDWLEPA